MSEDSKALWNEIYRSDQYKEFKRVVRKRDNYECQTCGSRGTVNNKNRLHVHHILPKSRFMDLMFNVDNGIVLCNKCHILEHKKMREDGRDFSDLPPIPREDLVSLLSKLTFTIYNRYKTRKRKRRPYSKKPRTRTRRRKGK